MLNRWTEVKGVQEEIQLQFMQGSILLISWFFWHIFKGKILHALDQRNSEKEWEVWTLEENCKKIRSNANPKKRENCQKNRCKRRENCKKKQTQKKEKTVKKTDAKKREKCKKEKQKKAKHKDKKILKEKKSKQTECWIHHWKCSPFIYVVNLIKFSIMDRTRYTKTRIPAPASRFPPEWGQARNQH